MSLEIQVRPKYGAAPEYRVYNFESYFRYVLDGADYEGGSVEWAQSTASNTASALGRLVETLYEKGILTKHQVMLIADDYKNEVEIEVSKR
jgi:hypothetical protein